MVSPGNAAQLQQFLTSCNWVRNFIPAYAQLIALVRRGGFRMFTDHRNLRYIFNPVGAISQVTKPQADMLERWAVYLRCFEYTIEHIAGS